jgi:hypothetical protein
MEKNTKLLFDLINKKQDNKKLASMVSEVLNISENTAYRKINGSSTITVDEFFTLVKHFDIDLSHFYSDENHFTFQGNLVYNDNEYVKHYFDDSAGFLNWITKDNGTLFNLSKDIPLFYYFHEKELGWFKIYFMLKYILIDPKYANLKFSLNNCDEELIKSAMYYSNAYQEVNTSEVWNLESVNTTLHQLEFACTSGMLDNSELIEKLFVQFKKILYLVEEQCKSGKKYAFHKLNKPLASTFKMHHNELYLAHNSYFLEFPSNKNVAFVSFGVFNYIHTENIKFNSYTKLHFDNIQSRSIFLNENENDAKSFFQKLHKKIDAIEKICMSSLEVKY